MKLFEGFNIEGPEVRWIPPSIPRGRPEGYWQETGHWVTGYYDQNPFWLGGPQGLIRAAILKIDANGTPIYATCHEPVWLGEQIQQKARGDDNWEDLWIMPEQEPYDVQVAHGNIKVKWNSFKTTWITYLWEIETALYMDRRMARNGAKKPFEDARGCFPIRIQGTWS